MRGPLTPTLQLWLLVPTGWYAPLWPSPKSVFPTAVKEWSSGTSSHPYRSVASAHWGSQQAALTVGLWQTGRRKGELPPWQGGSLESCPGAGRGDQVLEEKTLRSELRGCRQLLPTREVIYCSETSPSLFLELIKQPHWAAATLFPGFHWCEHPLDAAPSQGTHHRDGQPATWRGSLSWGARGGLPGAKPGLQTSARSPPGLGLLSPSGWSSNRSWRSWRGVFGQNLPAPCFLWGWRRQERE